MQFIQMIENVPKTPGVYQMFDAAGGLLYVGKAKNLWNRLHQYVNADKLSYHIKLMRRQVARVEFITTATESDALILESDLIKNKKPRYNIDLTDDKMYPMLALSNDPFPRLVKFRGRATQKRDIFGPYSSVGALNDTIKLIQKVARIRTCTNSYMHNRARPCLLAQIGRCSAPCMHINCPPTDRRIAPVVPAFAGMTNHPQGGSSSREPITPPLGGVETRSVSVGGQNFAEQYKNSIVLARQILSGDTAPVISELTKRMDSMSDALDFEGAALIRDQIRALSETAGRGKKATASADYFAISMDGGGPAIAVARVRNGAYLSHQIIYPKQTDDMTDSDILEQTILWFYGDEICDTKYVIRDMKAESKIPIITNIPTPLLSKSQLLTLNSKLSAKPSDPEIQKLLQQIAAQRRAFGNKEIKWRDAFDALEKWLGIQIDRADVFDNSHLFGTNPVGAMIVFTRDGFAKKEYRHYKLEDKTLAGNDIGMMHEFLFRRYRDVGARRDAPGAAHEPPLHQLLIVDGGMAQWNVAQQVLHDLGLKIPVIGMVKGMVRNGDEHFILPDGRIDTSVPKDSDLFLLLRRVRDEAHRFAIEFHKKRRGAGATASALDEIEGIGAARRRALLRHFGSAAGIADADIGALARVPGISKSAAEKIYFHFHPDLVE